MPTLPPYPVQPFFSKDPDIKFSRFFQVCPQVGGMPTSSMQLPIEQAGKPIAPPLLPGAELIVDPIAQTPVPPSTGEIVSSALEDKLGSWYESGEEMEKGDEEKHSGPEEVEQEEEGV